LRRGLHYPGRNWTRAHRQWIARLAGPNPPSGPLELGGVDNAQGRQYDVAPDGRFLIATVLDNSATAPITLLTNWNPEAKK
jgi:hypothetical protein